MPWEIEAKKGVAWLR